MCLTPRTMMKARKHEIATTDNMNWNMTGQSFSKSRLSVCSNSRPALRAKVYRGAVRLYCARNVSFSFGTVLGRGGRSLSDPKPRGAWGPAPVFTLTPVSLFRQRLIDFATSYFSKRFQSPPTRRGGSELFGPQAPGGPEGLRPSSRTRAAPLWCAPGVVAPLLLLMRS